MFLDGRIPMYIAVQLENCDNLDRIWLTLPVSKKEFADALAKIGVKRGEFIIADYSGKAPMLSRDMMTQTPLAVLNQLAERLNTLTDDDIVKLCAISLTDYYFDRIGQYIDFTYATGDYTLLPDITHAAALADYYLASDCYIIADKKLKSCIDRREFGKNLAALENGVFTPQGYITSKTNWSPDFKDRVVPERLNVKGFISEDIYSDWSRDNDYGKTYAATIVMEDSAGDDGKPRVEFKLEFNKAGK